MTNLHTSSIQKCKTIRRNNVGLHNRLLPLKKNVEVQKGIKVITTTLWSSIFTLTQHFAEADKKKPITLTW